MAWVIIKAPILSGCAVVLSRPGLALAESLQGWGLRVEVHGIKGLGGRFTPI